MPGRLQSMVPLKTRCNKMTIYSQHFRCFYFRERSELAAAGRAWPEATWKEKLNQTNFHSEGNGSGVLY